MTTNNNDNTHCFHTIINWVCSWAHWGVKRHSILYLIQGSFNTEYIWIPFPSYPFILNLRQFTPCLNIMWCWTLWCNSLFKSLFFIHICKSHICGSPRFKAFPNRKTESSTFQCRVSKFSPLRQVSWKWMCLRMATWKPWSRRCLKLGDFDWTRAVKWDKNLPRISL